MLPEFQNAALLDFSRPENEKGMQCGLETIRGQLGKTHPLVIGGRRVESSDTFQSVNPADPSQCVGNFAKATPDHVNQAVEAAERAFESWRWVPPAERANVLLRVAGIMKRRRNELSAAMIYEVGKSWPEADGDTAEAIDFCEFYAREMLRWGGDQPVTPYPGEANEFLYIPLGVGAVIPPWNFPLAITTGMTVAAVVTGNTVVLKPSSDAPFIAWKLFEILEEAGVPPGVVNFLPGPGGSMGDALVEHPRVRFIAFTGSKEVGIRIHERAARVPAGQIWLKRMVLEMGGKDFTIVDEGADLDAAAAGVAAGAFGFQGQKCSACSRAIIHRSFYDEFVQRLKARVDAITVGATTSRENYLGPVVSARAEKTILEYMEVGKKEGRLLNGGGKHSGPGYFLQPTVIADVKPDARIAQEEIFGLVLAVIPVKDYDEALRVANNTDYGLTGGVYTKNPQKLERARREFFVGNLYLNRKCTGAIVGAHPFGGFNMSGTDSKAGGRDYLLLFLQAKSIAEKVG